MWAWIALAAFILFIITIYLLSPLISPLPAKLDGAHVVVTGGSSGIGKSLAIEAIKNGAKVTLVARDKKKLEEAKLEVFSNSPDKDKQENVQVCSVDLSHEFTEVESILKEAEKEFGPVDILCNCAGTAVAGYFEELSSSTFKKLMDVNYLSAVHATKALVGGMKSRGRGRIVFVSSQAGQLGLFGYTAYSASKFALRGLAEALQMEFKPYGIHITLAFPPDTDTPGYHEENKTKPKETKLISDTSGTISSESVAQIIMKDTLAGRFFSSVGIDGLMLSCLTCGFAPITTLMEALQQVVTMGLFRLISLFYLQHFNYLIRKCKTESAIQRERSKKSS